MRRLSPEPQPESYDRRYVAFLDILGFAEHVRISNVNPARAEVLHRLMWSAGITEEVGGGDYDGEEFTVFSDSLLVSHPDFTALLHSVSGSWKQYARQGFFLRGGVAYGDVVHRGSVAYGQAVIDAYRLESKVARVPRVVIDPAILVEPADHPGPGSEILSSVMRCDTDGICYLDTYSCFSTSEGALLPGWLDDVKPHIEEGLVKHRASPEILAKFRWSALRFNEAAETARPLESVRITL